MTAARAILLALLVLAVQLPALDGGFLHDDDEYVTANPVVQRGGDGFGPEARGALREIWLPGRDEISVHHMPGMPLTATSFWLEWRLWGADARGYRTTNALLHLACALLLWAVLARMQVPGAWWAALLWAVHPVCVESAAWIAERKNTLSLALALCSTLAWLRWLEAGARAAWWGALAAACAALCAKAAVVPLPVVLLGLAIWWRGRFRRADAIALLPFFAAALAASLAAMFAQHFFYLGDVPPPPRSPLERLLGASFALGFYAWKTLWPTGLMAVYPRWHETLPAAVQILPGIAIAAALAASWSARLGWGRHALLALGGWVLVLAPTLGLASMSYLQFTLVADHFQYHALPFAVAGLVACAMQLRAKLPARAQLLPGALAAALALGLAWGSADYSAVFRDERSLWRHTLSHNPDAWLAHQRLGALALREGDAAAALPSLERAAALEPGAAAVHNNLGAALGALGRRPLALRHFRRALELAPNDGLIQLSGAIALLQAGRPREAIPRFENALHLLRDEHSLALARQGLERARRAAPD